MDHGALTDALIAYMDAQTDLLIGDGLAPLDGGWLLGQPNNSVFRPYAVLVSGGAMMRDTPMNSFDPNWSVSWSLRSFGGSRKQVDWAAHKARLSIESFVGTTFGAPVFKVYSLEWKNLGAVTRIDSTDPPFWQVFDTFNFVCSK